MKKKFLKYFYWVIFLIKIHQLIFFNKCVIPVAFKMKFGNVFGIGKSAIIEISQSPKKFIVVFDPYKHCCVEDCIVSAYHEFRHLQQRYYYGNKVCDE